VKRGQVATTAATRNGTTYRDKAQVLHTNETIVMVMMAHMMLLAVLFMMGYIVDYGNNDVDVNDDDGNDDDDGDDDDT